MKYLFTYVLLFTVFLSAQEEKLKEYSTKDVVITANKYESPLYKTGSAISIIDSADIASSKKSTVFELLKNEYGVHYTQEGGPGKFANIYLRGDKPGHTLILLDGVEVNMSNDPGSTYDFSQLQLENVERIEILRGPQSTLYGSEALSGVINIISKKGITAPTYFLGVEGGSYNTYKYFAGSNGKISDFNYSLSFNRSKTDGFSSASEKYGNTEKDGGSKWLGSLNLGYDIHEYLKANFTYNYHNSHLQLDQKPGAAGDDSTYYGDAEEFFTRGSLDFNYEGLELTTGVAFSRNIRWYEFDNTVNNPTSLTTSRYDGNKMKYDAQVNYELFNNFVFNAGAEYEVETAESEYIILNLPDWSSVFPKSQFYTTGVYLQNIHDIWFYSGALGVRYDKNNRFDEVVTFRYAPSFYLEALDLKIRGSVGNGYKAPTIFYLFDPVYGNPDLTPEKSYGWEAGFEKYFKNMKFSFGANYFNNRIKNQFGYDPITFRTINIDQAFLNGVEFFANINPLQEVKVKLNYTYIGSKDRRTNPLYKDQQLLRIPYNKAGINVNYTPLNNLAVNCEVMYVGKRDDLEYIDWTPNRVKLADYTLLNAAVSYTYSIAQVYVKLNNITNADYEEVHGYGTEGRAVYGGVKFNF